jgi:hypothetical protein
MSARGCRLAEIEQLLKKGHNLDNIFKREGSSEERRQQKRKTSPLVRSLSSFPGISSDDL